MNDSMTLCNDSGQNLTVFLLPCTTFRRLCIALPLIKNHHLQVIIHFELLGIIKLTNVALKNIFGD